MKLLDTSVIVDHLRGYEPATARLAEWIAAGEPLAASECTRFELLAGTRADERDQIETVFGLLDWVPVGEEITRQAGTLAQSYRRSHSGIDAVDYLVAGTAQALDAELVTTNLRHFSMFAGLQRPYPAA